MKQFIILTNLIFLSLISFSQVNFIGYLVDKENKKMKGVNIKLYKGNEIVETKKWNKKFDYNLTLEAYYTLELSKEGFVTKRIAISTFEGDKGAEPFMFMMELLRKKEIIKDVEPDFPTAIIKYKKNKGEFNFDVAYSKSIRKN